VRLDFAEMQRIAFISTNEWAPWGGSEACWATVAEKLVRAGVQVHVSVKTWDEPVRQVERLESLGCRIFYRPQLSVGERLKRRFILKNEFPWHHMQEVGAGADLVVISQGGNRDGLGWMEMAQEHGYKYAVISESANEQWWPQDDVVDRLRLHYEGASAAYFVAEGNLVLSRKQFGTPLRNGRVIRNPFNVRYDARPAWPASPGETFRLACVARLEIVQKAQDLLLDVLALPHWRTRDVRLTFVGSGVNERSLRRMAQDLKLANVSFAGFVDDIENVWSDHHALVLASRFEGTPLALVEAMLCGRACIVTDVGGNRELVRDGANGFIARAATVELLDEAMNRAWENRDRLREMGEVAARDVREWVTPDPMEDFVRELTALADGSDRGAADGDEGVRVVGRPVRAMGDTVEQSVGRGAV
jgi:glycosyltransferase involved in cell wall biosynthesis